MIHRRTGTALTGLCALAFVAVLAGAAPVHGQSNSSVFPDPNAGGGVTVRPASSSVFPDPNVGASSGNGGGSVFPDPSASSAGRGGSVFPDPNAGRSSGPAASPFPSPGGGGFAQPQAGPSEAQQACVQQFNALREARDERGKEIQAVMKRKTKPGPDVACKLFRGFSAAEAKMLSFLKSESKRCGIPPDLSQQLAKGHAQTTKTTEQICTAAAQPRAPAGPRLSDVLGAPSLPTATNERPAGGSTFDTINGNVLAR